MALYNSGSTQGMSTPRDKPSFGNIVIPYTQGLWESFKKICEQYGIHTHFKGSSTLRQLLARPKDQDPKEKKNGVIYSYQCGETACNEEYIGKTSRTLGGRYRKHLKQPFPIHVCIQQTGHDSTPDNFSILGREDHKGGNLHQCKQSHSLQEYWLSSILIISGIESFLTPLALK